MNRDLILLPGDTIDEVEASRQLNVSIRTMRRYRAKGLLPFRKVGNRIYFKWEDVKKLVCG